MLGFGRSTLRVRAGSVAVAGPSRTFEATWPRARTFLRWTRTWVVRRRFVVVGLPLRDLLVMHSALVRLGGELQDFSVLQACAVVLGTRDALRLDEKTAREIWEFWHEANCLPAPRPGRRVGSTGGPSPLIDLVLQLERWPFNFAHERVMAMTAAEAVYRVEEFGRAIAAREAAQESAA